MAFLCKRKLAFCVFELVLEYQEASKQKNDQSMMKIKRKIKVSKA